MKLLFVCTHNRCRSILAEAICRDEAGDVFDVRSAGSQPAGVVFPGTLNFLTAHNIRTDGLQSQSWDEFAAFNPDVVITVCDSAAGEACPLWMGSSLKVHWGLTDPSKETDPVRQLQLFTDVAAELRRRIRVLKNQNFKGMEADAIRRTFMQVVEQ
ncbi:arsenate reductase ArsC [Thalassolituus sp. LLYu03]|uniref:arsenate reductase ArsC n=1 Tax=Thalassolituus sp. LLYu03 TaxID=3421656 RepID=UPI003D29D596